MSERTIIHFKKNNFENLLICKDLLLIDYLNPFEAAKLAEQEAEKDSEDSAKSENHSSSSSSSSPSSSESESVSSKENTSLLSEESETEVSEEIINSSSDEGGEQNTSLEVFNEDQYDDTNSQTQEDNNENQDYTETNTDDTNQQQEDQKEQKEDINESLNNRYGQQETVIPVDQNEETDGIQLEDDENIEIDVRFNDMDTIEAKKVNKNPRSTTEEEKKAVRNRLFDNVKDKYQRRIKREISLQPIPEGPRLPEMNYDSLPEYIRELLSLGNPIKVSEELSEYEDLDEETNEKQNDTDDEYFEDLIKQDVADRIQEILSNINSYEKKEAPKTYGMNLTENGGYVWNDLWSEPGYSFDVAIPSKETEKPTDTSHNKIESYEIIDVSNEDLDDIYVNIHFSESKAKKGTDKSDQYKVNSKDKRKKTEHKDLSFGHKHNTDGDSKEIRDNKKASTNVWEDLFKNKEFWKWLEQWTSMYMEQLIKHVKVMIHDEVLREIHNYSNDMRRKQEDNEDDEDIPIDKRKDLVKDEDSNSKNKNVDVKIKPNKDSDESGLNNSLDNNDHIDGEEKKHPKHNNNFPITKPDADKTESIREDVKMEHIYGNSVGNEQVTNIFVFYPKENLGSLISELNPETKINQNKSISQNNLELAAKKENKQQPSELENNFTSDNPLEKDTSHKNDQNSEMTAINTEDKNESFHKKHDNDIKVVENAQKISSQENNIKKEDKSESETAEIEIIPYTDQVVKESNTNNEMGEKFNVENQSKSNSTDTEKESKEANLASLDKKQEVKENVAMENEKPRKDLEKIDVEKSNKDVIQSKSTEQGSLQTKATIGNDENLEDLLKTESEKREQKDGLQQISEDVEEELGQEKRDNIVKE